ncbi:2-polyprenyl-6-methoxyphenol hydroxylase-like FAD-dependent oxidoreductase [Asanoa ferruginea]|uniref:2-polyprenyl-6-methoxyphenol hydroxylase-like FAD-dependent oxidoreductase n=1 Tax=Asanoa ferruginea TaxID=53367 RepID=A0A3D9ZJ05_9ACTN|nr:2-polyprenyl-6-methoxyphenol hydroxylase-like FAD-dependent oxidoreductase [Asanoa ferruginea]
MGGGPAGVVLGLLLARQGVEVTVLEKHADFLRDFRGDTVHPSTLTLLDEIGLGTALAGRPGRKVDSLRATFDDGSVRLADFSRLPGGHPYVLFLPQWDFLDVLADEASKLPTFTLLRSTEVVDVLRDGPRVVGVRTADGGEVRARLTVACDGRGSVVRQRLGLRPREFAAPMDVLWFRISRQADDPPGLDMRIGAGGLMLCIDRGDYFQCAYVIAKGGYDEVRADGLDAFRARVAARAPALADRVGELTDWADVRLLTVQLDRLRRWSVPGALLIGDAAHAMSPIGGVGINLAVQDAVATARILGPALAAGRLTDADLDKVRRRRRFPTVVTQAGQRLAQRRLVDPLLHTTGPVKVPAPLRLLGRTPMLQRLAARIVGLGARPEHASS